MHPGQKQVLFVCQACLGRAELLGQLRQGVQGVCIGIPGVEPGRLNDKVTVLRPGSLCPRTFCCSQRW